MGLISRIIARRATSPSVAEARDLFDLLHRATEAEGKTGFRLLRDEIATLIIAGHETTALSLFWSVLLLADHPEAQTRIAAEARDLDLGPEEAAAGLGHLPFTRAVVSEALRLYPPAAMIARQALSADQAGDVEIPARAIVMIAPWVLHRHRGFWTEPDRFDPSRFMSGAAPPERFTYLPFGAGPRVCVGASFALAEATLALAVLVRDYVIKRADDMPVRPVAIITTHPDRAPPFQLLTRSDQPVEPVDQ
jgi:unspecific monooxygenase